MLKRGDLLPLEELLYLIQNKVSRDSGPKLYVIVINYISYLVFIKTKVIIHLDELYDKRDKSSPDVTLNLHRLHRPLIEIHLLPDLHSLELSYPLHFQLSRISRKEVFLCILDHIGN